ncbi:transcription factor HES-5-like isoform X2 [Pristis pectinata]|uniref:transcription factor HES-5-like isoform X2 n=1 Tax=Pristis pectinata TaxID=685728 RepID=UPI00223E8D52|nr:transcription factor HES-5-like isoform X2 [Pristis pectinata]
MSSMTPAKTAAVITGEYSEEKFIAKQKSKIMKITIEKRRRDRINSSINQLKTLLGREFQTEEPNMKLEKADILKMTVNYLKYHNQQLRASCPTGNAERDYNEGYSRCLQEALRFFSTQEGRSDIQKKLVTRFQRTQQQCPAKALPYGVYLPYTASCQTGTEQSAQLNPAALWRPW